MVALAIPQLGYGSDETGLVWGYRFTADHSPKPIDCREAVEFLSDSTSSNAEVPIGFVWLHFSLSNAASVRWMRGHLELPEAFYESLHETIGSTRLEMEDDAL